MVCNDVYFAEIICAVQIELEIDLEGEYHMYLYWVGMCLYELTFSFWEVYLEIKYKVSSGNVLDVLSICRLFIEFAA